MNLQTMGNTDRADGLRDESDAQPQRLPTGAAAEAAQAWVHQKVVN
jgi:hypothetical protein